MLPIGLVSNVSSPSELYIMTSLTESESLAITLMILLSLANTFCSSVLRNGRKEAALSDLQFFSTGYTSIFLSVTR